MIAAIALNLLIAAGPEGSARLDQGMAEVNLRLTSFETERVSAGKRGRFTSAELLYRSAKGDRLDVRILYRGPGELPAKNVTSILVQTTGGGLSRWTPSKRTGCRVKLYRATAEEVAGRIDCAHPESGPAFEAAFDARR